MLTRSLVTLVVLSLLLGCVKSDSAQKKTSTGPVQSKDKLVEVTLPDGWETATLPSAFARIQARCAEKNAFCIVISESKEDFNHKSIKEYADTILQIEEKQTKMADRTVSGPKAVKVNGADALQYEVRGTFKNLKLCYLKTFMETPTRWNQVMCWTTPSNWELAQDDFRKINESLKVQSGEK
jgi:hypothetical protein